MLTDRVPDLKNFFIEGLDYYGFDTIEEAEQRVLTLMDDESLRGLMGSHALAKVQPHSYDQRVNDLLKTVGLI